MNIHNWDRPQAAKLLLQSSENSSSAPMKHHAERGLAESVLFSGFLTFAFGLLLLPLTTTSLLGYPFAGTVVLPSRSTKLRSHPGISTSQNRPANFRICLCPQFLSTPVLLFRVMVAQGSVCGVASKAHGMGLKKGFLRSSDGQN